MAVRRTIRLLSVLALVVGLAWLALEPHFEPLLTSIMGVVGLLASYPEEHLNVRGGTIDTLLSRVQDDSVRLSTLLPEIRRVAVERGDTELAQIVENELEGYAVGPGDPVLVEQRLVDGFLCLDEVNRNHSSWGGDPVNLFRYFKSDPSRFVPTRLIMGEPLSAAEERERERSPNAYLSVSRPASAFGMDLAGDPDLWFYADRDMYTKLIRRVRKRLTAKLLELGKRPLVASGGDGNG